MANQQAIQTRRYFLQGDREAGGPALDALLKLAALLLAAGTSLNLGAYGEIPRAIVTAFQATGRVVSGAIRCHLFRAAKERPSWTELVDTVDCSAIAAQLGHDCMEVAYGLLWGLVRESSSGYVFLPGRDGTRMHLDLAIRWQKKVPGEKRITLLGWSTEDLADLAVGTGLPVADGAIEWPHWIRAFGLDEVEVAANFLLGA